MGRLPGTLSMKARYLEKVSAAPKPAARDNSFYGRKGTSHESRETLIQHLLNEGIHQGRHTRTSLEQLSDRDLVALHDEEHEENGDVVKTDCGRGRNEQEPRKSKTNWLGVLQLISGLSLLVIDNDLVKEYPKVVSVFIAVTGWLHF